MNSKGIKVEGEEGLYRDPISGGIYADDSAYARYKAAKDKLVREVTQQARINRLEQQMAEVQTGIKDILSILRSK
jgi:hypothetical protein